MPVTFSVQINIASVSAAACAVETTSGEIVTPLCATLRPAIETLEQRTVLLIGPFSVGDSLPLSVEIVGQLEDVDGNSLAGLKIEKVTNLAAGPSLVFAERFAPDTPGLEGECPAETRASPPANPGRRRHRARGVPILTRPSALLYRSFLITVIPVTHFSSRMMTLIH